MKNGRNPLPGLVLGLMSIGVSITLMFFDPVIPITLFYSRAANGTLTHNAMMEVIEGIHISAYLFNITNAEEFTSGEHDKLKVQEVGPFTYSEARTNKNFVIDEEAEEMRYTPRIDVNFIPEASVGRPEDIDVTLANIAMLSIASKVGAYSYFPQLAFNLLASQLNSKPVVTMRAKDYLWGYDEPLIRLGHNIIPGIINFDRLGILDRLYDKKAVYNYVVSAKNSDKFAIKSVNGIEGLEMWNYENPKKRSKCNSFIDAFEGINYPAMMTPETPIRIYRSILCRILELDYFDTITTDYGAKGLVYRISNRTYTTNNDTKCLCIGECQEYISHLSPCFFGLPVALSNAHFLYADPEIYSKIEGIQPDEEKHGSNILIDPIMGLALKTEFSVQLNVVVDDVTFNSDARRFSKMLVPVGYFKIVQPPLKSTLIFQLRLVYVYGPYLVLAVQIIFLVLGLTILAYSRRNMNCGLLYLTRKEITFYLSTAEKAKVEQPLIY
ncbi:scavenger receptor class B member 1 [Bombyx mori]|uniref:Uncharacterized protein n=1 Tax=Bombyx mori TaxID=7091 RepID=A0A8R2QSG2_BOMMO|nr:scavenger receptor class B member 1 [Bombyx mori]XP_037867709.1 scavenger receptor class B member 1 [Bombyx mori]XP_037867710.1 scavenger receptor class B member 1 [Bombyx mori]